MIPTGTLDADDDMPIKYSNAYVLSNDLEMEYNLVKWNLGHYNMNSTDANEVIRANSEIQYIDELVEDADYGEASITPINKFINIIDWRFARYGNVSWEFIFTVFKTKITLFGNFNSIGYSILINVGRV